MAIMQICSSSNHSPTLPNISLSSYSSTKPQHQNLSYSYIIASNSSLNCTSISFPDDATILCGSRVEGLKSVLPLADEIAEVLYPKGSENEVEKGCKIGVRDKRKKGKRRASEYVKDEKDDKLVSMCAEGSCMTPKEEAKFAWYIKETARIEAVRKKIADCREFEVTRCQWAKAAGITQHKLDKILCNGRESREIMVSCYRRLVISIASAYLGKGLSLQDLIQEGSIGLLRGVVRFNPKRGNKLSTYAYWWIRQGITKAIAKKSRIIRLPGSMHDLLPKVYQANTVLSRKLKRFPTSEEIAETVEANPSTIRLLLERNRFPISMDQARTSQGCMSLQDMMAGPDETTPEAMVKKKMIKQEMKKLLNLLSDREAEIVKLHYGLNGESPWSYEEIGRLLKLSRERVRQINLNALAKLQQATGVDDLRYLLV